MGGLMRTVARTTVIAGTAQATTGRVARRQASKFAEQDAQVAAQRQAAYAAATAPAPPPPASESVPVPPAGGDDLVARIKELGELKEQGLLTEEEFAAQKAKLLG
jgi:hypothetical protein